MKKSLNQLINCHKLHIFNYIFKKYKMNRNLFKIKLKFQNPKFNNQLKNNKINKILIKQFQKTQ